MICVKNKTQWILLEVSLGLHCWLTSSWKKKKKEKTKTSHLAEETFEI